MDGQQDRQGRRAPGQPQGQAGGAGQEQQRREPQVHRALRRIAMCGVASEVEVKQGRRTQQQTDATGSAQHLGQAGQVVGRHPTKGVVVDRGQAGGRQAQHEAVKGQVVGASAHRGGGVVFVVAAFAVATVQVAKGQRVLACLNHSRSAGGLGTRGGRHLTPEPPQPQPQGQHGPQKHRSKQAHQQIVWKQGVKIAARLGAPQGALAGQRQQQKQRQARRQGQTEHQTVALVQPPQRGRPGVIGIGLDSDLSHALGHVHGKRMGRRVLAGVQTGTTVVAQISQIVQVGLAELQSSRHGRKYGAKAFAVAAGIADLHLARQLSFGRRQRRGTASQGAGLAGQGFKLLHERLRVRLLPGRPGRPASRQSGQRPCRSTCPRRRYSPGPAHYRPSFLRPQTGCHWARP